MLRVLLSYGEVSVYRTKKLRKVFFLFFGGGGGGGVKTNHGSKFSLKNRGSWPSH